ncbi:membrane cofactor protein-like [Protopterus annectens]|uniref:membrane cofactor protein-like n=1 Tax=Protopterus annectens TaxID=7888 RepID=UPI001CF9EF98|nr:membrane cofactor protein-like [Protopterus annectens]
MAVHIIIFCYILLAGDTAVLEVDAHDCGPFPSFTNGITEYPNKVTTSGSAVHLSCEKRYRLQGAARRVCSSSGWVGGNATCVPVMCPKPEVKDGHVVYENGPENQFNTSVTFKCNEGFRNRGSLAVACNKDGHWDPPLPTCEGFHNKTVGEYPTRLSDGVRTSDVPLGNTEGVHNKTVGENPARLSYGVRTSDVPLGNTEGIHNKTVGEYSTRLSYGVSTSDVPLGNTEGPTSADVRKLSTVVPDVGGTSDASLGRTEGM